MWKPILLLRHRAPNFAPYFINIFMHVPLLKNIIGCNKIKGLFNSSNFVNNLDLLWNGGLEIIISYSILLASL